VKNNWHTSTDIIFLDIDLRHCSYNSGFRLGFGGVTNDRLSKYVKLKATHCYGTKDGTFKYSAGIGVNLDTYTSTWIHAAYTDDIQRSVPHCFLLIADGTDL
jgi:hypothetical protein